MGDGHRGAGKVYETPGLRDDPLAADLILYINMKTQDANFKKFR